MTDLKKLTRKNILDSKPYASARDDFKDFEQGMVFLDANENPFNNGSNRYPDPQQRKLKQQLAIVKETSENHILLGNGSDEVLDLLFRAFCEPHVDNVITLPPTYGMYGVLANLNAVENREVVLTDTFQPDILGILNQIDSNTKLIFFCSPNNPTGNSFSEKYILELLQKFDGLVVLDEAYIDFSDRPSWLKKLAQYPNLVITQTLSKAYGMAGIRVGILYAAAEIIYILNSIKPPYNINGLSQQLACTRVANMTDIQNQIEVIKSQKAVLISQLKTIPLIQKIHPSDANFVLIAVDNATLRYKQLLENRIVVRNRSHEPLCENCLRVTVGTPAENQNLISTLQSL